MTSQPESPTRAARPLLATPAGWIVIAALAAANAALVWVWTRSSREPPPVTVALGRGPSVALSPDGRRLVYVAESGGRAQLVLHALDRFDAVPIAGTEGACDPFFSPDGRWIGFFAGERLMKVSAGGGAAMTIAEAASPRGATWAPDGMIAIGLPDRAAAGLKDALAVRQTTGADSLLTARTLNQLANALREQGRFPEAESYARTALDIRQRLAGPRAPETAESLNTLGLVQTLRGYAIEGGALVEQAVDIWRATRGPDSEEFASGLRSLVRTWRERADYPTAERFERADLVKVERFERELLIARRKAFGDAHQLTTDTLTSLGTLLPAMGRDGEAEPLLREALATRRQLIGRDEHASVIEAMHNLALTLHDEGKLAEAEPLYRDAVSLLRRISPNHPQVAVNINNLGTLLEDMGRFVEAEAAYREAIALRRKLPGREQEGVARTEANLARLLSKRRTKN